MCPVGDIVFDAEGNLIIAQGVDSGGTGGKDLLRLEYQTVFEYQGTLALQILVEPGDEGDVYVPHGLVEVGGQQWIYRLGESVEDIVGAVNPRTLGPSVSRGGFETAFAFNDEVQICVFVRGLGVGVSAQDAAQMFGAFSGVVSPADLSSATGMTEALLGDFVWRSDGSFWAVASEGSEPAEGAEPVSSDEQIVSLSETISDTWEAETLAAVSELPQMVVTVVDDSGGQHEFQVGAGDVVDEQLADLAIGAATVTVASIGGSSGNYELLVAEGGSLERTIKVSQATGTEEFVTVDGDILQLSYTGWGRAELLVAQKPGGNSC